MTTSEPEKRTDDIRAGQRQRRTRARRRNLLIGFVSLLICVGTLLLVVSLLLGGKAVTRYAFLDEGEVWRQDSYQALVLQAGQVLTAPADGLFVPLVADGERVPKDETIGLIVPPSAQDKIDEAFRLRARLVRHQLSDEVAEHDRLADAYRTLTRDALDTELTRLKIRVAGGDTLHLPESKRTVDALLKPTALDSPPGLDNIPEAEADLLSYNNALAELTSLGTPLLSTSSGLVVYQTGPAELLTGTEQPLDELPAALFDTNGITPLPVLTERRTGEHVASLLTSTSANVAVFFPGRKASDFDKEQVFGMRRAGQGDFVNVRFNAFETVPGGVVGRFLLPTRRADWRLVQQLTLDTRLSATSGLQVPLGSLLEYDPADGIAILLKVAGGQIQRVPVFVEQADGRSAIIAGRRADPLAPARYDLYVLNPAPDLAGTYID